MLTLRKAEERGATKLNWLDSKHSFSFGNYRDLDHMGFGALRVINEDKVNPTAGFGLHPHKDMEILTIVLEGSLRHEDTLGTGSTIVSGDVQRMSAGTGILHGEYNPLNDKPVHFLQIWILPEKEGIPPSYEEKNFTEKRKPGKLTLIASKDGREGSLTIHQDASLYVLDLDPAQSFTHPLKKDRMAWVQMVRGHAVINGQKLNQGDGLAVTHENALEVKADEKAEVLLFDLASESVS